MGTFKLHHVVLLALCVLQQSAADDEINCYDLDGGLVDDVPCRSNDIESQPYCCGPDQDCMESSLCRNPPGSDEPFLFERATLAGEDWMESDGLRLCPEIDLWPVPIVVCNATTDDGGMIFACVGEDQDVDEACRSDDTIVIRMSDGRALSIDRVADKRDITSSLDDFTTSSSSETSSTDSVSTTIETTEATSNTPSARPRETETGGRLKNEDEDDEGNDSNEEEEEKEKEDDDAPAKSSDNKTVIIVGASLGAFGGICLILLGFIGCRWLKKRKAKTSREDFGTPGDQPTAKVSSSSVSGTAELAGSTQYEIGAANEGTPDPRFSKMQGLLTPESHKAMARVSTLSVVQSVSPITPIGRTVSSMHTPVQEMATPFNDGANFRIERKAVSGP